MGIEGSNACALTADANWSLRHPSALQSVKALAPSVGCYHDQRVLTTSLPSIFIPLGCTIYRCVSFSLSSSLGFRCDAITFRIPYITLPLPNCGRFDRNRRISFPVFPIPSSLTFLFHLTTLALRTRFVYCHPHDTYTISFLRIRLETSCNKMYY